MVRSRQRAALVGTVAVLVTAVAGCSPQADDPPVDPPTPGPCNPQWLDTIVPRTLTVGTDQPAYPPWFVDDAPENGAGFESAVAYAVANQLGYEPDAVTWVRVPFNNAIAPGPKSFDIDINQFSITEERRAAVDFSSPYYDVTQAVIALEGSPAASVSTLAELREVKLGAQVGTTSYRAITEVIAPTAEPAVFNNNDDAKAALRNGTIDALVLDLPTAFYVTSAEIDDAKIVGQLAQPSGSPEQFGLVLDKGSPLTDCVSEAVDELRDNGTLAGLEAEWLAEVAGAPVLS
ncbi:ABC transporter substrate-binding protein [Micromonospora sp. NBC_01813]|uniref:ABC transporter substrate-binding protein n=1 Tax=Micromonospora sp. NBC_01813 TaxID=2975988 RepID=UPI002DDB3B19|nr:ABC transporter substrate-binding protein [Micromonospora sp. NBC_01813]WSA09203.1 ABC transporter substrate-binding protein [Micromonospora sp. NBC_01813]